MTTKSKQLGREFFDIDKQLEKLSKLKDPLEKLTKRIDFEVFRETLNEIYEKQERKSEAGAKPYDYVLMFKIIILQRLYNLSDEQTEFQLNDRLSFKRFTGLGLSVKVPDTNTIWMFKEKLKENENEKKLFVCFYAELEKQKLVVSKGKMVDASFHEVPKQRNSREENQEIKEGKVPEEWKKDENKHKLRHKDVEARWTKKNNVNFYGYKNHIKADVGSKLIDDYTVTAANVHDSQTLEILLTKKDKGQNLYGDAAYVGQEETIEKVKMVNLIHEKGYKNAPLTDEQKEKNRGKSKYRAKVEHIFGFVENSMNGAEMRCLGNSRARVVIGITNLAYNICRAVQLGIKMFGERCVQTAV